MRYLFIFLFLITCKDDLVVREESKLAIYDNHFMYSEWAKTINSKEKRDTVGVIYDNQFKDTKWIEIITPKNKYDTIFRVKDKIYRNALNGSVKVNNNYLADSSKNAFKSIYFDNITIDGYKNPAVGTCNLSILLHRCESSQTKADIQYLTVFVNRTATTSII